LESAVLRRRKRRRRRSRRRRRRSRSFTSGFKKYIYLF